MKLTIFTPTFNRASTLKRLFESLCKQSDRRFEWLIVDDGSTDNTKKCIDSFVEQNVDFNIKYYYQKHGGKPRAQNKAIDLATGDLFITCDSNKFLANNAVEIIMRVAETIVNKPLMCGVGGYRADLQGNIWGGEMLIGEEGYLDCTRLEHEKYHIRGDKSTAFFTSVLKQYKSPEYPNEDFISEAVWLIPMAMKGYKTRWVPEIFIFGEYAKDGLTRMGANSQQGHYKNFMGFCQLVKVEKEAKGLKATSYLIYEVLEIAKNKGISDKIISCKIGCSIYELLYLRSLKLFHTLYGLISKFIKKVIGESGTRIIKKLLGR